MIPSSPQLRTARVMGSSPPSPSPVAVAAIAAVTVLLAAAAARSLPVVAKRLHCCPVVRPSMRKVPPEVRTSCA